MSKVLIIGGTRFVGPQLIKKLRIFGDKITVFCRGNNYGVRVDPEVEYIYGNREVLEDLEKLFTKQHDFVYDMCCFGGEHAESLVKYSKGGVKHLVFFSTAAVYQEPKIFPVSEDAKLGEWKSFGDYGTRKAEAEAIYTDFAIRTNSKLTIFRPVYLLGQNNYFDRENYYFSRILSERKILVPGNGNALIQFAFLEETAKFFALCPKRQKEQIEILNVASDEYISVKNFVKLCGKITGKTPKIVCLNTSKVNLNEERFYDDLCPFPNLSIILSNQKIKRKYGIKFAKLESGLKKIFINWKRKWKGEVKTYPLEEMVLEKLGIN